MINAMLFIIYSLSFSVIFLALWWFIFKKPVMILWQTICMFAEMQLQDWNDERLWKRQQKYQAKKLSEEMSGPIDEMRDL